VDVKVLVYGAGVLGSLCAARLKEGGNEVSLLARGNRLEFLRRNGILLEHAVSGEKQTVPIDLVEALGPYDAYDLLIVLMGRSQVPGVLPVLAENQATRHVVFMGNNAGSPGEYIRALGKERVLMGFYMAGGAMKEGVVWYADDVKGKRRKCLIGELDGKTTPRLEQVARLFEAAGVPVEKSPNIDAWLKTHAAMIMPIAGALYMAGGDLKALQQDNAALKTLASAWKEALQALTAARVPILPAAAKIYIWAPEGIVINVVRRALRSSNIAISFAHAGNARPEMRCLAGELLALARSAGIATPNLEKMQSAI
jgi:2-dehydropantoate 2-reductase